MFKREMPLKWKFVGWIVGGLAVIVVAPLALQQSYCPPQSPRAFAINGDENSNKNQYASSAPDDPADAGKKQAQYQYAQADARNRHAASLVVRRN